VSHHNICYIGLGSNIGNRFENISKALDCLKENSITVLDQSSKELTQAVEFVNQPDFLNMIVKCETLFSPDKLLEILLEIERKMGRIRTISKGPRIIDLDLLLYNSLIIQNNFLTLPHPGIKTRWFILKHLIEIDPNLVCPLTNEKYLEVYNDSKAKNNF
jgi:2-amino-4-hydroxy-6-hydroxymethyldihydropteridine diphosphokinase